MKTTSPPATKKVCVVGLGYTGLPTAAILASRGYQVHGVEVRQDAIETINSGKAHIVEPDLDMLVRAAVNSGNLHVYPEAAQADVFILCVPTPKRDDQTADLTYVHAATRSIAPFVKSGDLVVLESTSPPGTSEEIAAILAEETDVPAGELFVAHAPERVLPGKILREVVENDRIIGGVGEAATKVCADFYRTFVSGELLLTSARTAETIKLAENAFRDVNIAFSNELSLVADHLGLDIWELVDLANRHPRVNILRPGPGVGGHCIAVDPWFLITRMPEITPLMRTARGVNENKPKWVVNRVKARAERFKNPRIACLGLAYKPNVDDLRESPAVEIVRSLKEAGGSELFVVEPHIASHPEFALTSAEEALRQADIVVCLVAHDQFKRIPRSALEEKILVDTCGLFRD